MVHRIHNFSAGPCALPLEVVEKAQKNMADYDGSGMSVMEMSHRGKDYDKIHNDAEAIMRELLGIPDNYHILFLGGGASSQFYFVPMNYLTGGTADYVMTGTWAKKAIKEAKLFGTANVAASSANDDGVCTYIPKQGDLKLTGGAKYFHYTSNNTIFGTEYHYLPDSGGSPLICDMSSDIMSFPGLLWSSSATRWCKRARKISPRWFNTARTPTSILCSTPRPAGIYTL